MSAAAGRMILEHLDDSLLGAARAGDRAAFSTLVERYREVVFAYALARLRSRDEAEDLTQETFVRAFAGLERLRSLASWEAWLMRILRNLCNDALRRKRVRRAEVLDEEWAAPGPSPEAAVLRADGDRRLDAAIANLPEKYRVPLAMHYRSRLTYGEIALALGVPQSTVRGRLATALHLLRNRLGDEVG